jgi:hypothetical protein
VHGVGRDGQVKEAANHAPDGLFGFADNRAQPVLAVVGIDRETEARREVLPLLARGFVGRELGDGVKGVGAKLVIGHQRGGAPAADDAVPLRHKARHREVIETGQDFPSSEVTGDAEDDDDVVVGLRAGGYGGGSTHSVSSFKCE